MSRILVTGAGGYVGREVARRLRASGHEVALLVRHPPDEALQRGDWTDIFVADLCQPLHIDFSGDVIVHAAARVHPTKGLPVAAYAFDNIVATTNLVKFAVREKIGKILHLSTMSVYGQPTTTVVDEETARHAPGPYGMTKYLAECALEEAAETVSSVSVRLPGIIGPGASGPWLASLVGASLSGQDLRITNTSALFNNIVHVDDLASFFSSLSAAQWTGSHAFPLGTAAPMTIREVAALIRAETRNRARIIDAGTKGTSYSISTDYAVSRFGYRPRATAEVIRQFIAESGTSKEKTP